MEDAQDHHGSGLHATHDNVRRAHDHKLTRAGHPHGMRDRRVVGEAIDRRENRVT
jgi:hypothetical protein